MQNKLQHKILELIKSKGAITIGEYMDIILYDPIYGYYNHQQPFGKDGDFITSPELGSLFAHTLANSLLELPSPKFKNYLICELGAGSGRLLANLQARLKQINKQFYNQCQFATLDVSKKLRAEQKQNIPSLNYQYSNLLQLPPCPTIFIANELFDAIAIEQYVKKHDNFYIRQIHYSGNKFAITEGTNSLNHAYHPYGVNHLPDGTIFEHSPQRESYFKQIINHITAYGGLAIIIDYGEFAAGFGDTLQALYKHQYVSIFEHLGEADLTSHVNFSSFLKILEDYPLHFETWQQNEFLLQFGIQDLVEENLSSLPLPRDEQIKLMREYYRLVDDKEMGKLFKVLVVSSEATIKNNVTISNGEI